MKKRILGKFDDRKLYWIRALRVFLIAVFCMLIVFVFVIGVSVVSGNSMYPTLRDGQPVLVLKIHRELKRGDIVAIRMTSGEHYVKRIVGMPGDTIELRDGIVYVNGAEESTEGRYGETLEETGSVTYPLTLGEDQYFTLGDNREVSVDSRTYGPVSRKQIRGIVLH